MRKKLFKLLVAMIISVTVLFALGMTAFAYTAGDFTITATNGGELTEDDYTYSGGVLTIKSSTLVTISGTTTIDRIEVADGVPANITLAGVNIDLSATGDAYGTAGFPALKIADNSTGNVIITLADGTANTLKSGAEYAGVQKNGNADNIGKLTIQGSSLDSTGSLIAEGGVASAGIGGGYTFASSNIAINSGTVIATGSDGGAGIGGGYMGAASNITINGGTVTATGGNGGSGIGGGWDGIGSDITISGGSVKAVSGAYANAIGGGEGQSAVIPTNGTEDVYLLELDSASSSLTIDGKEYPVNHNTDGKVYVYLTEGEHTIVKDGAGTTYNYVKNAENKLATKGTAFTVTGENLVYGTDYTYPAETGVLTILSEKAVTIENADGVAVTTNRIEVAYGVSASITLAGVNIDSSEAAFMIADDSTGNVTITLADGITNTLKSGFFCAGFQKNGKYISETEGKLTIHGGTAGTGILNAIGGNMGAGIGGGNNSTSSNITISGGTVTAKCGNNGAGIGGGNNGAGSHITISGGSVTATSGGYGAGIGSGSYKNGTHITISGGTVTATGGNGGAGIGSGERGSADNIVISGGSVKAVAGRDNYDCVPAAIGQGVQYDSNASEFSNGAEVTPTNGAEDVYLLKIANPSGAPITIDGTEYTPSDHTAVDAADKNLYVYLTGEAHTVKVGESPINYFFDNANNSFVALGTDLVITADDGTDLVYGEDYTYPAKTGVLTILSEKAVTIKNAVNTATADRIEVAKDVSANITLAGVNINPSNAAAFWIYSRSTGNVTITLADGTDNTLKGGASCAGLQKNGDSSTGMLTIQGEGSLTAIGGNSGAGIGSGDTSDNSNILIRSGIINAQGGECAAGIGGGYYGAGTNIIISGGTVTATGGAYGAGIGGGWDGIGSDITINGGSVKVAAGENANVIGGGEQQIAVIPTDGNGNNVYLFEIANPDNDDIVINEDDYPDKHFEEAKIYAYLPSKTASDPNEVTVGDETTNYCYDETNAKWLEVIEAPAEDDTEFIYDGDEKTYNLAEGEHYTISDNTTQTDAGTYTVTAVLKDKENTIWSTGTSNDAEYKFIIKKAIPTVTAPTASAITYGQKLSESVLTDGWEWVMPDTAPAVNNTGFAAVKTLTDDNNYDYLQLEGYTYTEDTHRLSTLVAVTVSKADPLLEAAPKPKGNLEYDGSEQNLINAGATADGEIQYSLDGTDYLPDIPTGTNAGDYTVWYKIVGDENYNDILFDEPVEVTIGRKPITVTADNASKIYGEADPEFTYTATGLVNNDALTGVLGREEGEDVNSYSITQGTLTNENNPNYDITFVEGTLTIDALNISTATAVQSNTLTYNGTAQTPEFTIKRREMSFGTFDYSKITADDYDVEVTPQTNAGNYTATITFNGNYSGTITDAAWSIGKADPTADMFTLIPPSSLDYDGQGKTATVATDKYGMGEITVKYSDTPVNVGTYTVFIDVAEGDNYNAASDLEVGTFTINGIAPTYEPPVPVEGLTYTGYEQELIISGSTTGGEMQYSLDGANYLPDIPTGTDAKKYTVWYKVIGGGNYNDTAPLSFEVTIEKAEPFFIAVPTAVSGLGYTGQAQELITVGETANGEIQYSLDGTTYTSTVPTGTAVGDYTVYCKIIGDSNHNDKIFDPITVSIGKGIAPEIFEPTADTITYGQALSASALSDSAWSWVNGTEIPTVMNSGFNASMIVTDDNNYDYSTVAGYDEFTHTVTRVIPVAVVPAIPTVVVNMTPAADIAGKTISAAVTVTNPNNASLFDTPTAELTYTIDGFTMPFTGSFVIPEDTAEGTIITITATTAANENYDYAIGTTTVTVTSCTHENTTLMSDIDSHWYECLYCGADINKAAHSGGTATCNSKASCYVCSTAYGGYDSTNHGNNISEAWTTENGYHWHECNGCGADLDKGACTGGTANCVTAALCEVCGAAHGTVDPNNHTGNVSTAWTSDSEYHWHECACGADIDKEGHTSSGAATEDTAESCTICGYVIAPATGHIIHTADTSKWLSDSTGHWHKCVGCEEKMDKTTHISGGAATATTPERCVICGYVIAPATGVKPTPTPVPTPNPSPAITVNNEPQIKDENGKTGWNVIKNELEKADDGDTVVVDMNGTTKLPKTITSEIKGRDVELVLEMNSGITWTINGLDVTNPKNVDMRVTKGTKRIPVEVINNATGESYTVQLSLAHNGDFGFTAVLTVDLGKKNNGLIANLFWYNEKTDELEHVDFDEIQSGKAELMFTHASEWAVVIDEEVLGEYDDVSSAAGITDNAETFPDSNAPIAVAAISFAGLVLAAVMVKKRKAE